MKRAAQLLKTHKLKVAEVACQVGFRDVHYFSKCFKKAYGIGPTALMEKQCTFRMYKALQSIAAAKFHL